LVKAATALVSATTAVLLWPVIPKALALPSPTALNRANRLLQHEVAQRLEAEKALQRGHAELERRVAKRTEELAQANRRLEAEVAERRRAEDELRHALERLSRHMTNTPLGQVSSGCIYTGAKIFENGELRLEKDLGRAEVRALFESNPERFFGFTELDEPNSSFRNPPCSFHSGTKALAEEALRGGSQTHIWRCRLPFNELDHPCNLLTRLQSYDRVYDHITSVSHLDDYVAACLDLVEAKASFGIYNVTNPGAVTTKRLAGLAQSHLRPGRPVKYWANDEEFYRSARAPRLSCILDVTKLLRAGIKMRSAEEAVEDALSRWQPDVRREWRRLLEEVPV
jgi:hypothetical protein